MSIHLPRLARRGPVGPSAEAVADAMKATRQREQVDSRWPALLERSGLAQERLVRNHIGESLDYVIGFRGD